MPQIRHSLTTALALAVILLSALIYLNGAVFSVVGSRQIDYSINYTAGRVLQEGGNIYDRATLRDTAERSGTVTLPEVYREIFATYIQPPTTAMVTYFFAFFEYRTARLLWLGFTQLLLLGALILTLLTLPRSQLTLPYLAGIALLISSFGPLYMSLSLGQVDGIVIFSLALSIWAWHRGLPYVVGAAIVVAASFKIIPGLLILYFLWKRNVKVLIGGIAAGVGVLALSLLVLGPTNLVGYVREIVPLLLKGSVHHQNVTISAFVNRLFLDKEWLASLAEIPNNPTARILTLVVSAGLVAAIAYLTRGRANGRQRIDREVALALATAILLSSIAWEFYLSWLLPSILLLLHPVNWPETRGARGAYLGGIIIACMLISFPVGFLTESNGVFYHPLLLPGYFLEQEVVHLYADINRQFVIPLLRSGGLLLLCAVLASFIHSSRRAETQASDIAPSPVPRSSIGAPN